MVVPEIAKWAKKKGIGLVAAPDWTHPLWFRELKTSLVEVGEGIYAAKGDSDGPRFLLATEISSIYSQGGKTRRIHNLLFIPSFEAAEKISEALRNRGANLLSDGRPIIGLSSPDFCELVFSTCKEALVVPAHIWTPWFSLYGSNSGFDSIEECFGKFREQIFAVETGLSSDPGMNWRIEELDSRAIVSFSDSHSPAKMGREATVFEIAGKLSYQAVVGAIKNQKIAYTVEFYPEEGKYHFTGHRSCGVIQSPEETKKLGKICPVCGKKLTVGVMYRVEELAKRPSDYKPKTRPPYKMLVPLQEILAESMKSGVSSQKVGHEYERLTAEFSSELEVLLNVPVEELKKIAGERTTEGIDKVRKGDIVVEPGYDGVFGIVKIWLSTDVQDKPAEQKQMSLF